MRVQRQLLSDTSKRYAKTVSECRRLGKPALSLAVSRAERPSKDPLLGPAGGVRSNCSHALQMEKPGETREQ